MKELNDDRLHGWNVESKGNLVYVEIRDVGGGRESRLSKILQAVLRSSGCNVREVESPHLSKLRYSNKIT